MITFEFDGINELQKKVESIASEKLIKKTTQNAWSFFINF